MRNIILLLMILSYNITFSQISRTNYFFAKEYSKEISLYKAKEFVIKNILKESSNVTEFEIDPLAATTSGEITSLVYKCSEKKIEGLILGFYGNYWNNEGVVYQGYAFKNLTKDRAMILLDTISKSLEEHKDFINSNINNNNVYFQFDDLTILIYNTTAEYKIRVFWDVFDAEWTGTSFNRTKKRFEKSVN